VAGRTASSLQLTQQLAAKLATPGGWTYYTPVLTASVTNPTLGTGGGTAGAYMQIGTIVHFYATALFGSSGFSAGAGTYFMSLPSTAAAAAVSQLAGYGLVVDASAGAVTTIVTTLNSTTQAQMFLTETGSYGLVRANAPYTTGASDEIRISGTYEAA
jgi:hypothetical protein